MSNASRWMHSVMEGVGGLASGAPGPIGVDVTPRELCAVQVARRGATTTLLAGVRVPLTKEGTLTVEDVRRFAQSLPRAGFVGKDIAMFAPADALLASMMELPPRSSGAPLLHLARLEMARIHRREPASFELAMWDLPTPDRKQGSTQAMVLALPEDAGERAVSIFHEGGLRVVSVDARMCALARACVSHVGGIPSLVGVLDVGWSWSHMTLLHVGGLGGVVPLYERKVEDVGLASMVQTVSQRMGLSPAAVRTALVSSAEDTGLSTGVRDVVRRVRGFQAEFIDRMVPEVQRSFSYGVQLYPSLPMTSVLVVGEGEGVRGLKERLASVLGLDVHTLHPGSVVSVAPGSALAKDASLTPALGLALAERRHIETRTSTTRRAA
jgi:Tfp pilus assembly PilM family ATPase